MRSLPFLIVVSISLAVGCSNGLYDKTERPLVISDIRLSDREIADLKSLAMTTGEPWLIRASPGQLFDYAVFFLLPETETEELRRGSVTTAYRGLKDQAGACAWVLATERDLLYAQLAVEGRAFDQLRGDRDIMRPFTVRGHFEDTELISLIKLIRSKPMASAKSRRGDVDPLRVSGDRPVSSVSRESEDRVLVMIDLAPMSFERVELRKTGDSWALVSARRMSASNF